MELGDGSVLPSYLRASQGPGPSGTELSQLDLRLRVGRVVASHAPDASSNSNKQFYEYDVEVDIGAGLSKVYPRAVMADPFGGIADFCEWTPRLSQGGSGQIDKGTRVAILCLNGDSGRALIVGGVKHNGSDKVEDRQEGHHLTFEFNGVRLNINKDGDLLITHKGATGADGVVKSDEETTNGTSILLDKNGDIKLSTGKNATNLIHLDSKNKKIFIDSTEDLVEIHAAGNIKLQSAGVLTGSAPDATMMGTTYRNAQKQLHSTIAPLFTTLATQVGIAATGLATAATAHLVPIVGPITGAPALAAASVALATAAPIFGQIMAALQTFEAGDSGYLSSKNKSD